ncbi:MAG: HPr family phosphocarrier protein [Lachnospiraceae bacterium]|nr:HPr family phosphocarrier protein [Lachnospiraceae bacterium]
MIERAIEVNVKEDFDARPIAMLVQVASRFESSIYIVAQDKKVNAKSIMGMMTLTLNKGETITVTADGEDEQTAIESISNYLNGKEE